MSETRKFKIAVIAGVALSILALSYNAAQEYIASEIGGYVKRRAYYASVISKKDLSMHRGMHWKEKK